MVSFLRRGGIGGAVVLLAASLILGWAVLPAGANGGGSTQEARSHHDARAEAQRRSDSERRYSGRHRHHGHELRNSGDGYGSDFRHSDSSAGDAQADRKAATEGALAGLGAQASESFAVTPKVVQPSHAPRPVAVAPRPKTVLVAAVPSQGLPPAPVAPSGAPVADAGSAGANGAASVSPDLIAAGALAGGTVVPTVRPGSPRHARVQPGAGKGLYDEPMMLAAGPWPGLSLQAATRLTIPILFGAAVAMFALLQALVDRRDPKLSRAPERGEDDTVGFV